MDTLYLAFTLLLAFLPFLCFGVVFLGFIGLFVWVIVNRSRPITPEQMTKAEADARQELESARPGLLSWSTAAFTDLAAEWQGKYTNFLVLHASGHCPSLQTPDRAHFAFVLHRKGNSGFLRAVTSNREVKLEFRPDSAAVRVDGRLIGTLGLSTGMITDEMNRTIGQCKRESLVQVYLSGIPLGPQHKFYPLTLDDRVVAKLNTASDRGLFGQRVPLTAEIVPDLKPDEENWLLALCVLEVGFYGVRSTLWRQRSRRL